MSNEQTLPVYVVPGTDGNPDVYYLRSFTSDPDTQISKEQYDGLTRAISDAAADLQTLHAQADPASPDFVAPAVNADVAGSAAAPVSQPVQTPAVAEDISATEAPADQTDQPAQPESEGSDTPSGPGLVVLPPAEPEPTAGTNDSESTDNSGTVLPGSDVQSPGTDQRGSTDSGSTAGQDQAQPDQAQPDDTGAQVADQSGSGQSSPDPNEGISPDQSQSSGSSAEPDPNDQVLEDQSSESSSTPDSGVVVDPTNPSVVAGQTLPSSVTDSPATVDPSTGDTPDLTNHPVDSTTLPDPTVVQAPPVDLPVEDHGSWFAKEKQRILDILKSESDRVSSEQEPE